MIELINHLKLSTANVVVDGSSGSNPFSVVAHAEQQMRQTKRPRTVASYDRVFCVFDKDEHENHSQKFSQVLVKIAGMKHPGVEFTAIASTPCFEIWLIMHFEPASRPFTPSRGNTAAQETVKYLEQCISDYAKGRKELFDAIGSQTTQAIQFSEQLERKNVSTGSDSPSTQMHELVKYLQNLKA